MSLNFILLWFLFVLEASLLSSLLGPLFPGFCAFLCLDCFPFLSGSFYNLFVIPGVLKFHGDILWGVFFFHVSVWVINGCFLTKESHLPVLEAFFFYFKLSPIFSLSAFLELHIFGEWVSQFNT